MVTRLTRSAGLHGYRELVLDKGGDPSGLLAQVGIDERHFDAPDALLPAQSVVELLERSSTALSCQTFGLELAQRQNISILGPLGVLAQQADVLGDVMADLARFLHLHSQADHISIEPGHRSTFIAFEALVSFGGSSRQLIDLSLLVGVRIAEQLVDGRLPIESVHLSFDRPDHVGIYESSYGVTPLFGAERSGVVLANRFAQMPIKPARTQTRAFMSKYLQNIEGRVALRLEDQVTAAIHQLLPLGKADLSSVCFLLGVERRTVQRRLKQRGTSFAALLREKRKQTAIRLLRESNVGISQLAEMLGYAETSVFSRNFRRWTGCSPSQFLAQSETRWGIR